MFVILMGYLIDLFLLYQWLQTEPSLGVPHYQPQERSCGGQCPAHARGVPAVASFGQGTDPQQVPLWRRRLASPAAWVKASV